MLLKNIYQLVLKLLKSITLLKNIKKKKKILTEKLIKLMENSETDCLDTTNQQIIYKINKVKQPINSKYLNKVLTQYFEHDNNIDLQDLNSFINDNRSITQKPVLLLKYK